GDGGGGRTMWGTYAVGSMHTSVFNAAVGDGSVATLSVTMNTELVARLIDCKDGVAVSIP
ncbi:MAG: DUF1559 domain-containing protein, partial [Planctomycetaceae bacterium]|nr:DUF1559 domain-containing protein [Planctomycetaceae bacterium]